jgi:HPt (histidine-containing phosphotransfer) domain-containing protein
MSDSIFRNSQGLDTDYLEATYGNDAETATIVFEQYLSDLSGNLEVLKEAIRTKDVSGFQHHIHKQKPGYSYVGLTDITQKIQELQMKCNTEQDMANYRRDIDAMIARIEESRAIISETLSQIQS